MIRTEKTKFGFLRTALAVGVAIPILAGAGAYAQAPAETPTTTRPITVRALAPSAPARLAANLPRSAGAQFRRSRPKPSASS